MGGLRSAVVTRARRRLGLDAITGRVAHGEAVGDDLARRVEALESRAALLDHRAAHAEDRLAEAERELDITQRRAVMLEAVAGTTALVAALPPSELRISVILATYNRPASLLRAVASVLDQTHAALELVVVDDASDRPTREALATIDDPRLVAIHRVENAGASAARNVGLEHATGDVIVYLDDDNVMCPLWLRAVAWGFESHPEAEVLYGGRSMEFVGEPWPWVQLDPWDRNRMQTRCLIDQNVIAHRAGLPGAYLDPEIETGSDWDLALRLTADRDPVLVPVVAVVYRTTAADRLSDAGRAHADWVDVQRRELRRRPLRILVADLGSEPLAAAAAQAEADALRAQGAEVAWWREADGGERLEVLAAAHDPRVVAVHGTEIAWPWVTRLERLGRPFYLRRRGAPGPLDALDRALAHPFCLGELDAPGDGFVADELLPLLDRGRARISGFRLADAE